MSEFKPVVSHAKYQNGRKKGGICLLHKHISYYVISDSVRAKLSPANTINEIDQWRSIQFSTCPTTTYSDNIYFEDDNKFALISHWHLHLVK